MFDINVLSTTEQLTFALRGLYIRNGFSLYRMSKFEEYDLYSKNKDFLISDSVITFTEAGRLMALKPDVTLSIIKNNKTLKAERMKLCYDENVYRISKNSGTFREIMQSGVECIGSIDVQCLRDTVRLACDSLALVSGGEYALEITNLDIITKLISELTDSKYLKKDLFRLIGEKNTHGIRALCEENGLEGEKLCFVSSLYGRPDEVIKTLREKLGDGFESEISALENVSGAPDNGRIQLDFSAVGDPNYYNGIIFKGYVRGVPEAVLSGGQYDNLMSKMHRPFSAVGFAVYLELLERYERRDAE